VDSGLIVGSADGEVLSEAYERLHHAGPEFGGTDWLSNHGPMAVEVLVRRGYASAVPRWVDKYLRRLEDLPASSDPITDETWREALGDIRRVGDWTAYLTVRLREAAWRDVLELWWPRLLPGILAGATHGVIRVGHAVRTLLAGNENDATVAELAHGLAYWAARSQGVPGAFAPSGRLDAAAALKAVPRIGDQSGGVADRIGRLDGLSGWSESVGALRVPADPREQLADLVTAATLQYLTHGHGGRVLLIHAATAPNAVLHTLPALPEELWEPSLGAAWAASAAITAGYAPSRPAHRAELPAAPSDFDGLAAIIERAATHSDEHVIKFADTAADVYGRTGDTEALAAAVRASQLIAR
jgi:hypothetical protein